eukprot:scaffold106668_cov58-Attheya_sp.AAC.1
MTVARYDMSNVTLFGLLSPSSFYWKPMWLLSLSQLSRLSVALRSGRGEEAMMYSFHDEGDAYARSIGVGVITLLVQILHGPHIFHDEGEMCHPQMIYGQISRTIKSFSDPSNHKYVAEVSKSHNGI